VSEVFYARNPVMNRLCFIYIVLIGMTTILVFQSAYPQGESRGRPDVTVGSLDDLKSVGKYGLASPANNQVIWRQIGIVQRVRNIEQEALNIVSDAENFNRYPTMAIEASRFLGAVRSPEGAKVLADRILFEPTSVWSGIEVKNYDLRYPVCADLIAIGEPARRALYAKIAETDVDEGIFPVAAHVLIAIAGNAQAARTHLEIHLESIEDRPLRQRIRERILELLEE